MKKRILFYLLLGMTALAVNYSFAMQRRSNSSEKFYCYSCKQNTENKTSENENGLWYLVFTEGEIRGIFCHNCYFHNLLNDGEIDVGYESSFNYDVLKERIREIIIERAQEMHES